MQPRAHDSQAQAQAQCSLYRCVGSEPASWPQLPGKKKKKNSTPKARLLGMGGIGMEVLPPSCTPTLRPIASPGPEKATSKDAQPKITAPLSSACLTTLGRDNEIIKTSAWHHPSALPTHSPETCQVGLSLHLSHPQQKAL